MEQLKDFSVIVAASAAFILASYEASLTFTTYLPDFRSACLCVAYLNMV